jgi:hypothetical protein
MNAEAQDKESKGYSPKDKEIPDDYATFHDVSLPLILSKKSLWCPESDPCLGACSDTSPKQVHVTVYSVPQW